MAMPLYDDETIPNDLPPIPPDLAMDEPPLTEAEVEALVDDALSYADDAKVSPADAALRWAEPTPAPAEGEPDRRDPVQRFSIDSPEVAEWAMAHVATSQAALDGLTAQRDAYLTRIKSWFDRDARRHQATIGFFSEHLARYALARRAADPKHATTNLPSGKIATRKVNEAIEIVNPDAVLEWALAQPAEVQALVLKREVLVSLLRQVVSPVNGSPVTEDGVVVPGTAVRPEGVSVSVKPTG